VNGFTPYRFALLGLRGQLSYVEGRLVESISMLEACLDGMKKQSYRQGKVEGKGIDRAI